MTPHNLIIAFDSIPQLDSALAWAYKQGLHWYSPAKRQYCRDDTAKYAKVSFSRKGSHALWADNCGILYQSPLDYFRNNPTYRNCTFTHANKLPNACIDCTIPETEEP